MTASRRRLWLVVAALAACVVLPLIGRAVATQWHADVLWASALRSLGGSSEPYDLQVFLEAGDSVARGDNPYVEPDRVDENAGSPYVYPPVLAFVVAPLAALPHRVADVHVAGVVVSLVLIASIVGGLLLLGVQDWRCHVLAVVTPPNLEAIEYGAIGPVLFLLVGVLWRYRDALPWSAAASGAALVLKLFLWPLVAWLALTSRARAAVLAVSGAVALALVGWAAIGFAGLLDYPGLLRKLVDLEGANSYSAYAVLVTIGLPDGLARASVVVMAAVLLLLARRAARAEGDTAIERDRRSLTFALAAALVATPILWLHYLGLLFVPIALARSRLSLLWVVPFSMTLFEALDWYRGWPRGDAEALMSVVAVSAVVFAGSLMRRRVWEESPATTSTAR
jgi:hypothetical protein